MIILFHDYDTKLYSNCKPYMQSVYYILKQYSYKLDNNMHVEALFKARCDVTTRLSLSHTDIPIYHLC